MAERRESRPVGGTTEPAQSSSKAIESESSISDAGDQALRCAWLRVHADLVRSVDPSGQLSAQLLDFADLLEVAEARGWFE